MERDVTFSGRQMMAHLRDADRPCIVINHQAQVVFANPAAAIQVGISLEQLTGLKLAHDFDAENASASATQTLFVPELQAWVDGIMALQDHCCELIEAANKTGGYDRWLAVGFKDERSRELVWFLGVRCDESISNLGRGAPVGQVQQTILQYRRTLTAQQHALSKLLPLLGPHSATKLAMRQTQLAIDAHVPVLITGTKGCGKRTLAEAILSNRARGSEDAVPPILISCQLIDKTLLREITELVSERLRIFKQTKGLAPSILLDRIDLLPEPCLGAMLDLVKLASQASIVTTSLVGFDNSTLNMTRHELLSTLSTLTISLCPVKDRSLDIAIMLQQLLHQSTSEKKVVKQLGLSEEAIQLLHNYSWPGNLSEFVTAIKYAVAACDGAEIRVEDLPISLRTYPASLNDSVLEPIDLEKVLAQMERQIIERALGQFPRNRAAAARYLGISRTKLFRKVQQLGIQVADDSEPGVADAPAGNAPPAKKPKELTADRMIQLAIEEGDELPVFREISDSE
jgi:transcriptional regulator of aromatic amino acid metabolism